MTGFNSCLFSLASSGWLSSAFFVFRKGTWNVLSRNKTHYTVIHSSIMRPSHNLRDSHCLLSTVGIFASLPFPCEFLTFVHEMPNLFVTEKHCVFLLTGTLIFLLLSSQPDQDTSLFYNTVSSDKSHSISNVLYKEPLLQRLFNSIWGPDCDLNFVYL